MATTPDEIMIELCALRDMDVRTCVQIAKRLILSRTYVFVESVDVPLANGMIRLSVTSAISTDLYALTLGTNDEEVMPLMDSYEEIFDQIVFINNR